MAGTCEHSHNPLGSIKLETFFRVIGKMSAAEEKLCSKDLVNIRRRVTY